MNSFSPILLFDMYSMFHETFPALSRDTQGLHVSRIKNSTGNGRVHDVSYTFGDLYAPSSRPSPPYFFSPCTPFVLARIWNLNRKLSRIIRRIVAIRSISFNHVDDLIFFFLFSNGIWYFWKFIINLFLLLFFFYFRNLLVVGNVRILMPVTLNKKRRCCNENRDSHCESQ